MLLLELETCGDLQPARASVVVNNIYIYWVSAVLTFFASLIITDGSFYILIIKELINCVSQFKDAGGFESLVTGKTTDVHRIDVTERITSLERLNPTPRPTTSPFLEGKWKLEWFGSNPPALLATQRVPATLINLSKVDILVKDGYTKLTANIRILNSVETKFILSSKLSVEGPLRMKEESIECLLESPIVIEQALPEQLRSAIGQASSAAQQLPVSIRDALSSGVTIPLNGTIQRLFMISYLDDEILIIRDTDGLPEVLTRLDVVPSPGTEAVPGYER